jgi:predicted nuclease of predicted toxin-antitoxin system
MRILIDECVNPRVKQAFKSHDAKTVIEMDWRGIGNGKLLALAEEKQFQVFVTVDQNLEYQQNMAARKLGFVVVHVPDNNIKYYEPIFARMCEVAEAVKPGHLIHVHSADLEN